MEVLVDGVFYIWESQADNVHRFPICMLSTPLTLDQKNDTRQKKNRKQTHLLAMWKEKIPIFKFKKASYAH